MKIEVYSPTIRRKEMDAVLTALVEDKIGPGEHTQHLVQIAKERLKFDYSLALRSPVIALSLALKSLNLEDGQGVIISALSPGYYKQVIEDLRLVPIYADVLPSSASIGPETIEAARSRQASARCVVVHHTLGFVPDMAAILDLGLPVIDDRSQSYGALSAERPVPASIVAAAESSAEAPAVQAVEPAPETPYSPGALTILGLEEKDLLTAGGGALLYAMNRREAGVLRNYAELLPEYGLPDMNAAMGVVQFREAGKNLEKRKEIAKIYAQASQRTRHKRFVQNDIYEYNNYVFPLILETGMKDVKAYAKKKDIAVESALEDTLMGAGLVPTEDCPESYSLSLRTALFPLYPRLSGAEIEKVSKLILTLP
ncbi:aminotransferase, DegT/DnrJ/EryC1/StrS family [Treponema primitia ZAS-2]|uniref:Aminotransferase, DegT/DnrJ/EryC1/StrS family n=1 Tax=Treponema primitia (strain ATCC BAA-887 / DSM 12427 / ZAS-2) TaxID=545694 RepID=F5YP65_TREPZ|nr:DegT/DnrJ/EryC1/StrS family aminotransferase [Treponema primitia]AEF84111.1 aminotransferase, DegT/DnrJ/EryC1/StrS family [Treponema primitia ZAS-2]